MRLYDARRILMQLNVCREIRHEGPTHLPAFQTSLTLCTMWPLAVLARRKSLLARRLKREGFDKGLKFGATRVASVLEGCASWRLGLPAAPLAALAAAASTPAHLTASALQSLVLLLPASTAELPEAASKTLQGPLRLDSERQAAAAAEQEVPDSGQQAQRVGIASQTKPRRQSIAAMEAAAEVLHAFRERALTIAQLRAVLQRVVPDLDDDTMHDLLEHAGQPTEDGELARIPDFCNYLRLESALHICATPCSPRCRAVAYTLIREFTRLSLSSFGPRALQSDARVMAGADQRASRLCILRFGKLPGAAYMLSYTWGYKVCSACAAVCAADTPQRSGPTIPSTGDFTFCLCVAVEEMADVQTKAAAFIAVTVQRACHNSFIEWAKGDSPHDPWPPTVSVRIKDVLIAQSRTFVQKAKYTVSSVIFVAQVICVAIGWMLAHSTGGTQDLKKCFDAKNLTNFFHIGLIYALGDIFEMESDSSTYTVLSQSKLIITATLMWVLDGSAQSMMQWFILFTTSSGMLEYVLVGKAKGGAMTFSVFGVCLALIKVMISCYVAVLNTKALKRDSNPFPVQFSCLKVSWAMASLVYMAIGVILVYFGRVMFLGGKYDPTVFNAGVTVVLACIAYVLSKDRRR
eukprot:s3704_g1.t2